MQETKDKAVVITGANSESIRPLRRARVGGHRNGRGQVKARKKRRRAAALQVASTGLANVVLGAG